MTSPQQFLAEGDPRSALAALQAQVRDNPSDPALRIFLFQLLCVLGEWPRARQQLQVCGTLDAGSLAMVNTYREALSCEAIREAVFAGLKTPVVFGQPQPWLALMVQALQSDSRGDEAGARRLREEAFEAAPASPGSCDGVAFEWLADADSRLGPVLEAIINGRYCWVPFCSLSRLRLEAPTDLRDLVWTAAHLDFPNGGETVALVPTRYAGTTREGDAAMWLARRTDWVPLGSASVADDAEPVHYRGLGQRLLTFGEHGQGLLQMRDVIFSAPLDQAGEVSPLTA